MKWDISLKLCHSESRKYINSECKFYGVIWMIQFIHHLYKKLICRCHKQEGRTPALHRWQSLPGSGWQVSYL